VKGAVTAKRPDVRRLQVVADVPPLRFRRVPTLPGRVLLSNDAGDWTVLADRDFQDLVVGRMDRDSPLHAELRAKGFAPGADLEDSILKYRQKNDFCFSGPSLHILAVTLRCNEACSYCHSSKVGMHYPGVDMPLETAEKIVDRAFESPSRAIHIEFQGGEPLVAWETVKYAIEYAMQKNRYRDRDLAFTVVTNLSLMTEDKMHWLLDREVMVCTSLDGPKDLHDANRPWAGGSGYDAVVRWMDRFRDEYAKRGYDTEVARVNALLTVTRASLGRAKDILDEYEARGLKAVHLRTLDPFGFARPLWNKLGYTADEFLVFWREAMEDLVERNLRGVELLEKTASIHLTKILTPRDPNYMDTRSPCGAGIGQIAYNYDGRVYTCDEGRMIGEMGDELFLMGQIDRSSYAEMVGGETVKAIAVASTLDNQPYCDQCTYKPYCGVCPAYNYVVQGDIFGQMPSNDRCKVSMGIQDWLFTRMVDDPTGRVTEVFRKWTEVRDPHAGVRHGGGAG
jgi:His-Xaa-Ser system radical SAM maturase HxsB